MESVLDLYADEAYISVMPVKTLEQKAERFVARVTRADKRLFAQAASLEGRSMATFVIAHARQAAEQTIARRKVIHLGPEDSRRFVEALLARPRPPTARMKRAIKSHRQSVRSDI